MKKYEINFSFESKFFINKKIFKKAFQYVLENETNSFLKEKNNFVVSCNFVSNLTIKELNLKYRNLDKVTDVLSFSSMSFDNDYLDIGDIFVNYEQVMNEEKKENHFLVLFIHSLFHLLNYDHDNNKNFKKMYQKEQEIWKKMGI